MHISRQDTHADIAARTVREAKQVNANLTYDDFIILTTRIFKSAST